MAKEDFKNFGDPVASCDELVKVSHIETFPKDTEIIGEEDDSNSVYFILSGRVRISNYSKKGREVWHYELGAGRVFGEIAALTDRPRIANVNAQTVTTVAILTKSEFLDLLKCYSDISVWLLRDMSDRLADMTRKVNELVAQNVRVRIYFELISICPPDSVNNGEYWITPTPVLADLARRANTDRESVSREISVLLRRGILRRDSGSLVVADREFLEASVEF